MRAVAIYEDDIQELPGTADNKRRPDFPAHRQSGYLIHANSRCRDPAKYVATTASPVGYGIRIARPRHPPVVSGRAHPQRRRTHIPHHVGSKNIGSKNAVLIV
jgi:hypothetical protein